MSTLIKNIKYAFRQSRKSPGFTAIVVLVLALGIGASTTVFSIVNAVLLRPLPYPDSDRLVKVYAASAADSNRTYTANLPDFKAWRINNQVFTGMAAVDDNTFNLTGGANPELVLGSAVSSGFFSVLGTKPVEGRDFQSTEEQFGNHLVTIISHGLWRHVFGCDPQIVGRTLTLNDQPYTVIGIMPPGFQEPQSDAELWVPMAYPPNAIENTRREHFLQIYARLRPGVTIEQAQANMKAVAASLAQEVPENKDVSAVVTSLHREITGDIQHALLMLFGAVGLVLLIACANVAFLLLARVVSREKEIAIRSSLGAGRIRILGQLLTENLILCLSGGVLGLLLTSWGVGIITAFGPRQTSRLSEISIDTHVVLFTITLSFVMGLVFGLIPILQYSEGNLRTLLKATSRNTTRSAHRRKMRALLVVSEAALAFALLIGAGLLIRSLIRLHHTELGFKPENTLTFMISLPESEYPSDRAIASFYKTLVHRIETIPGVSTAGATSSLPLTGRTCIKMFSINNRTIAETLHEAPIAQYRQVTADYFETMGYSLCQGRFFENQDMTDHPTVVIINENLARKFFDNDNPIGQTLRLGPPSNLVPENVRIPEFTIIGVITDIRFRGLDQAFTSERNPNNYLIHTPIFGGQEAWRRMFLVVKSQIKPLALVPAIREQVFALDKNLPISEIKTMTTRVNDSLSPRRLNTLILILFAMVALVLAGMGMYGILAHHVIQRSQEIGIRRALGATNSDILKMVLGHGMSLAAVGLLLGICLTLILTRFMKNLLYEIQTTDMVTFIGGALLLTVVALAACVIPARRAAKIDPMEALRYE